MFPGGPIGPLIMWPPICPLGPPIGPILPAMPIGGPPCCGGPHCPWWLSFILLDESLGSARFISTWKCQLTIDNYYSLPRVSFTLCSLRNCSFFAFAILFLFFSFFNTCVQWWYLLYKNKLIITIMLIKFFLFFFSTASATSSAPDVLSKCNI